MAPAAWDATVQYILSGGDAVVTHGGHTYVWSGGGESRGVEPPADGWVQLDGDAPYGVAGEEALRVAADVAQAAAIAAQSGASVAAPIPKIEVSLMSTAANGYTPCADILVPDATTENLRLNATPSGGPFTLAAGGTFSIRAKVTNRPTDAVLVVPPGASELIVSNAAGTEKLAVENLETTLADGNTTLLLDGASIDEQIGTDLSVNGSNQVVSAAGGQFFVTAVFQATYTPAP